MTYKLKQWYPSLPKDWIVGMIIGKNDGHPMLTPIDSKYRYYAISKTEVESSPEFFAPYLFTTEDKVDVYADTVTWAIVFETDEGLIWQWTGQCKQGSHKYFSNPAAAQDYIDSQKKPIWKTEDGYNVFENEAVKWVIRNSSQDEWRYVYNLPMCVPGCATENPETYKVFKDEDKMNKWIEEQNKPKFEKGEWLYFDSGLSKTLFRFLRIENNKYKTTEGYQIMASGTVYIHGEHSWIWSTKENVTKATTSQIEKILSEVALHKGFKEGVEYKSATQSTGIFTSGGNFKWEFGNTLYSADSEGNLFTGCIYYRGVWAEIVEIPEYVKCVKSVSNNYLLNKVYKVQQDGYMKGFVIGEEDSKITLHNHILLYPSTRSSIFTESNREAFDAQFQTKELTITLDGDVVNTSHWGNNVKITYK